MLSLVISVQTPGHTRHSGESRAQARLAAPRAPCSIPAPLFRPCRLSMSSRYHDASIPYPCLFYHTSHMHHAAGVPFSVLAHALRSHSHPHMNDASRQRHHARPMYKLETIYCVYPAL